MFSGQLLNQEHEQVADLTLIAVQKGLVSDFSFVADVLEDNSLLASEISVLVTG